MESRPKPHIPPYFWHSGYRQKSEAAAQSGYVDSSRAAGAPGTRPCYGSRLRTEFEARKADTWPLNIGQVYTTLGRLERDGMTVQDGTDEAGRVLFALTEAGRVELRAWCARSVQRAAQPRDELAIKLVMAVGVPGVGVRKVVEVQRRHVAEAPHEYVRQRAQALAEAPGHPDEVARLLVLVLEQLICHTEARLLRLRAETPAP